MKKIIVTLLSFTLVICCFAQKSDDPLRAFRYVNPNASNVTAFDLQKIGQWIEVKELVREQRLRQAVARKNKIVLPNSASHISNLLNDWAKEGHKFGIDLQAVAVVSGSMDSTGSHTYIYLPVTNAKKFFNFLDIKPNKYSEGTHTTYYYYTEIDNDGYISLYGNNEVIVCDFTVTTDDVFPPVRSINAQPTTAEQVVENIRNLEQIWSANAFVQQQHAAQFISHLQGIDAINFQTHPSVIPTLFGKYSKANIAAISNYIQSLSPTYTVHFSINDSEARVSVEFPDGAPLLLGPTTELPQELIQHTVGNPNILIFGNLSSTDPLYKKKIDTTVRLISNFFRMDSIPSSDAIPSQFVFSWNKDNNTQVISGVAPDSAKVLEALTGIIMLNNEQLDNAIPEFEGRKTTTSITKERKMWNGFTRYDLHVATITTFTSYYYEDTVVYAAYIKDTTGKISIDHYYYYKDGLWNMVMDDIDESEVGNVQDIPEAEAVVVEEEVVIISANSDSIRKIVDSKTSVSTKILLLKDNYLWFTDSETAANEIATSAPMNEVQQEALKRSHYPLYIAGKDLGISPNDSLDTEINNGIITIKYSTPSNGHNLLSRLLH